METKPTKLRKVKTIAHPVRCDLLHTEDFELTLVTGDDCATFDREVNNALAEGWYLVKRYTLPSYQRGTENLLIAELQRYDDYDE